MVGIDAAWTDHHPSAVARIERGASGWRLVGVARSYAEWSAGARVGSWWDAPAHVSGRDELPTATASFADVACVAVDMPLAAASITSRRVSDQLVSRAYAARGAAVHSPTPERPGPIADAMRAALTSAGLRFAPLDDEHPPAGDVLRGTFFEVYPHTSIIELLHLARRLPYKVARSAKYWPAASPEMRRTLLAANLDRLRDALAATIAGVDTQVPSARALLADAPRRGRRPPTMRTLKGLEDALDAIVCAWTAARVIDGHARAYGDAVSAIRVGLA